jgi:hypothetical protein
MTVDTDAHAFYRDHVIPSIEGWCHDEIAIHKTMLVATNLKRNIRILW